MQDMNDHTSELKRIRGGGGVSNPYANKKRKAPVKPSPAASKAKKKPQSRSLPPAPKDEDEDYSAKEQLYDEDFDVQDQAMTDSSPTSMEIPDEFTSSSAVSVSGLINGDAIGISNEIAKSWSRPTPSNLTNSQDLNVQWLDIDMVGGTPLTSNPNASKSKIVGATGVKDVPIIRVYGVTDGGASIAVYIHGFTPYAYFAVPAGLYENFEVQCRTGSQKRECLERVRVYLDGRLRAASNRGRGNGSSDGDNRSVQMVQYVENRRSIMGYDSTHVRFLKVYVSMPTLIPALKRIMEDGTVNLPGFENTSDHLGGGVGISHQPFEANVPFVLRYMIDREITGAGWLTLPQTTYQIRPEAKKTTHCQYEIDVAYDEILSRPSSSEWSKIAPLRILSFDIECQGRKGYFPEAEHDPVIQISNVVSAYGSSTPIAQVVFTLNTCLPIVGANVISSQTEQELLLKWRAFLQLTDPDILTGYNVQNFDIPYILDRAAAIFKGKTYTKQLRTFLQWGRIRNLPAIMKSSTFQSAAFGKRNNIETTIHGRVIFDMLPYMQRNHKLSSYTLNSVSAEFLNQQKEDVHHSVISDLQLGTDADRHRLATYCLKDAQLPLRLMEKLSVLVNYIEMARVTGVPMSFLISRGQQIKVYSMLLRKCRNVNLLVPTLSKGFSGGEDGGYEGATVLDPIKSYYQVPIATLDFASLYPSIMQAYNLCYSTLVNASDVHKLKETDYQKCDNGHVFVRTETKKGILPIILEELLTARKRAKKDMKNAKTEFERTVQNGRQLALKVSANSVYGFTGATVGQLPCLPIASTTTSYGRQLLEQTKEFIEEKYTIGNGYKHDAQVVYGDTDSVMIKFGPESVAETFPLAMEAAEKCSKIFPSPILLEFEKVYFPYLLMNKKRYAGLMWTKVEKYDYMDTKGLETVRRDNCSLVREVIQTSLNKILIGQDVPGAINYVKSQIADLLQNKMDISRLVITKSLNKGAEYALGLGGKKEDYKMKQAHVELAARMKKRDAGSAPQMGDRVPYIIITAAKNVATYEKAEDPIYVLENNLPIDCKWYLTNQLSKPLTRIFEPIIDNVDKELLQGDHTRKIFKPTPSAKKGSLMMFAKKMATCMGCKCSIVERENLCKHCKPREAEIYLEKLAILREAEARYAVLWSRAQRIHGTVHNEIICRGDGCTCQFYRRKKVQADIRLAQEVICKFC